ncbi:MAG TPA: M20 family metallopeptidase [Gemmataceae bacterium]|nr:M20 family metallopeptidase [Gemmataceae bacterium]
MHETTRLLRDLVSLPSVNPMGRPLTGPDIYEHRVTAYLEDFFRSLGVPFERQSIAPQRDNILAWSDATAGGTGVPRVRATVIFEAHQDTVPTDNMTIEPFAARIENGRLFGRGACDIKGGMAAMLAAFARLVREKPKGAARIVMACTVDEEFTFVGAQRLVVANLRGRFPSLFGAIVAEPTQLRIVDSHKGAVRWDLTTAGRSCHSSRPEQGVNAIYRMAAVLPHIERYAEELRASRSDPRLGPPTLSVGRIDGGTSVNTVPDQCRIEIDRRLLPGEKAPIALEHLQDYLRRQVDPSIAFSFSAPWLSAPALSAAGSEELVARLGAAIDSVIGTHHVEAVPYGTDAAPIAESGIPAVVFGPGDIARAHTCDEWVPLDEVEQASEILYRLACSV